MILNEEFELYVFDVGAGQSIFFHPLGVFRSYSILIDVGVKNDQEIQPIDYILSHGLLPIDGMGKPHLRNLAITNYDDDHFHGLPYLFFKQVKVDSVFLNRDISSQDLNNNKPEKTESLHTLNILMSQYTQSIDKSEMPYNILVWAPKIPVDWNGEFNDLSLLMFIEYGGITICVPGDLENKGWKRMLPKIDRNLLKKTDIFIASHHGRDNGFVDELKDLLSPQCVVISDKHIEHDTQTGMTGVYENLVKGDGIDFCVSKTKRPDGRYICNNLKRKVLTTRSDGNIKIYSNNGQLKASSFDIDNQFYPRICL